MFSASPFRARAAFDAIPGVGLCIAVTLVAVMLQALERRVFGRIWLESLVLAIVVGAALRATWTPGPLWRPGIAFCARTLLEIAVVLLGASVNAATILAVGPGLLVGIALVVVVALIGGYSLGRTLGLSRRMAALVACGNSICGNSAIAAVAPVIGADGDDVATSIGFTAVLGVVVVLALPLLGLALHMSGLQFGALAGLTVYAVPQVLAATAPLGSVAIQVGTVVKLVRVLMLGPVCFALAILTARSRAGVAATPPRLAAHQILPWFIVGFAIMVGVSSLGGTPAWVRPALSAVATALTIVSMGALGLGADVRSVARSGARVSLAVTLSLAVLVAASLCLIGCLRLR